MSNQKFRPYFTASELLEVISALKENPKPSRMGIIRYLEDFAIKIDRGTISASLELNPPQTIQQKLGFAEPEIPVLEEAFETLWARYNSAPEQLSPKQLERINAYRYLNDMMNPQEEVEYELRGAKK